MTHALTHQAHKEQIAKRTVSSHDEAFVVAPDNMCGMRVRKPNAATKHKYSEALRMLEADRSVAIDAVAEKFGFNASTFRSFVRTWHPALLRMRRHVATAAKYADAIAALRKNPGSTPGEIAEAFGYSPDTFRGYLRRHAPELLNAGTVTADGRGCRSRIKSASRYDAAICFYDFAGGSLKSVANRYGLVYNSLYSYVRRNRPDLLYRHAGGN